MRLGVFGGSFDPVHLGHLLLAQCCQEQVRLDRVVFIPAGHAPHKPDAPRAGGADRVAMLQLALKDRPPWEISAIELDRGGRSYTVDTLRELRAQQPGAELYLLMGADSLADLPKWREPAAICELATPLAVRRAGSPEPDYGALAQLVAPARVAEIRGQQVEMPPAPISSSEIRRRIAAGEPWQDLVPAAVASYILEHRLYGAA
jgi:nicotinate-nucleotide adenylyltransferase